MDFVHDTLADGRPFRVLTVVDNWRRQSPMLEVGLRRSGETVGQALDRVLTDVSGPRSIRNCLLDGGAYGLQRPPSSSNAIRNT
jgi:hypothetical protein